MHGRAYLLQGNLFYFAMSHSPNFLSESLQSESGFSDPSHDSERTASLVEIVDSPYLSPDVASRRAATLRAEDNERYGRPCRAGKSVRLVQAVLNPRMTASSISLQEATDSGLDGPNNSHTSNDVDLPSESYSSGNRSEGHTAVVVAPSVHHQRAVNGRSSRTTESELIDLRKIYDIPPDVVLRLPGPGEHPTDLPPGRSQCITPNFEPA